MKRTEKEIAQRSLPWANLHVSNTWQRGFTVQAYKRNTSKRSQYTSISQINYLFVGKMWCKSNQLLFGKKLLFRLDSVKSILVTRFFYYGINWTLWCNNSPLLLHRTIFLDISERLQVVRMNNRFFYCWISKKKFCRENAFKKTFASMVE